jgi:hypothetical protein
LRWFEFLELNNEGDSLMKNAMTQYVAVVSKAIELELSDEQIERVAMHLDRTRLLSKDLMSLKLPAELELVEIYAPSDYPIDLPTR